jgi:Ca-activated chloride channel family protein
VIAWANPERLVWLWLVPVLVFGFGFAVWRNRRRRRSLADKDILARVVVGETRGVDVVRALAASLAATALILALARPQWGEHLVPAPLRGADVILVVDASLSMMAQDVPPDRLGLARRDLERLVDSVGPCRIGLVAFAGSAMRQIPLTEDRGVLSTLLDALSPDMLPEAGTDIGSALGVAAGMSARSNATRKEVVLVTDGGDHGGGAQKAAQEIEGTGAHLWVVGVGGDKAVPIPLAGGGVKYDKEGNIVTVHLERGPLQELAKSAGGTYLELSPISWNLAPVLAAVNSVVAEGGHPGMRMERIDRFPWFLGAALFFLLLETLLPRGRRRKW